jgi:prevent-host-death family protein
LRHGPAFPPIRQSRRQVIDRSKAYDYNNYNGLIWEFPMKSTPHWPVATAKAQFSNLLNQALSNGPQTVTRHGRPAIIVVSVHDWEIRAQREKTLTGFLSESPLRGSSISTRRFKSKWRKTGL